MYIFPNGWLDESFSQAPNPCDPLKKLFQCRGLVLIFLLLCFIFRVGIARVSPYPFYPATFRGLHEYLVLHVMEFSQYCLSFSSMDAPEGRYSKEFFAFSVTIITSFGGDGRPLQA